MEDSTVARERQEWYDEYDAASRKPQQKSADVDAFKFYKLAAQADVSGPTKAVLWALAHHADYLTGRCFLSNARLAYESGFSVRAVQNATAELAARSIIRKEPGTKRHSREQGANVYWIIDPERGAGGAPRGAQEVRPWGAGGAP